MISPRQWLVPHNTHKRQTHIPPVGFERAFTASGRQQTRALDRAAIGIGLPTYIYIYGVTVAVASGIMPFNCGNLTCDKCSVIYITPHAPEHRKWVIYCAETRWTQNPRTRFSLSMCLFENWAFNACRAILPKYGVSLCCWKMRPVRPSSVSSYSQ